MAKEKSAAEETPEDECTVDVMNLGEDWAELRRLHEPLRPELRPYVKDLGPGLQQLCHPLLDQLLPGNLQHCAHIHWLFDDNKREYEKLSAQGDLEQAVMLHSKPYLFLALAKHADRMDGVAFWKAFASVWTAGEFLWQYGREIKRLISMNKPHREEAMTEDERSALQAMQEDILVFRGYSGPRGRRGWSWTTDREQADWFAHRFTNDNGKAKVAVGTVAKPDVIAFFMGRGESEIVTSPKSVRLH
jgi:hypothetical protein